jgi:flagellum-specific ATP synthase
LQWIGADAVTVLGAQIEAVRRIEPLRFRGVVTALKGMTLLVDDLPVPVGTLVRIGEGASMSFGEVIGFSSDHSIVMPMGQTIGIRIGCRVESDLISDQVNIGERMLGRCLDGLGRPIDGLGPVEDVTPRPLNPDPVGAMRRRRIREPMHTGIRSIDLMTTLGRGQRIGIFSGPGVGKSSLLGQIARTSDADVNVIALIGERGREVREFIDDSLGPDGLARSIVVISTSDESPLMRVRAAHVACAAAEYFRDHGKDVMLMMDSVTRFAHAQRQIGLAVGEPPATKGYTPSVFARLALLLERAGTIEPDGSAGGKGGSITGLYTVLVEGDDMTEPVADAARGILDGHIILSRRLAQRAHFPAIDVLDSVSRVADDVTDDQHIASRLFVTRLLAAYAEVEDLVQIGAYARGSSAETDTAIDFHPRLIELLRQGRDEVEAFDVSKSHMVRLAMEASDVLARSGKAGGN